MFKKRERSREQTSLIALYPVGPSFMKTTPKCKETGLVTLYPGGPTFMKTPPKFKEQERFKMEQLKLERQHLLEQFRFEKE